MTTVKIMIGDVIERLRDLPAKSVHCVVTSPPYWGLRDYQTASWEGGDAECDHEETCGGTGAASSKQVTSGGTQGYQFRDVCGKCGAVRVDKQIGLEPTIEEYIEKLTAVFEEVWRVLRDDGTLWLNMGDAYNGSGKGAWDKTDVQKEVYVPKAGTPATKVEGLKPKDLIGQPWRLAFALQAAGWYLRSEIIWHKPNPMPESCTDRPTKSHEQIFLMSKKPRYFYDAEAVKEKSTTDTGTRNLRDVWKMATQSFNGVASGGNCRIGSPDCPVHDYRVDRARVLEYGGRLGVSSLLRNLGTDGRPASAQQGGLLAIPIDPCEVPWRSLSATLRNSGKSRMAEWSEQGEIYAGILLGRTAYKKPLVHFFAKSVRTLLSNTLEDAASSETGPDLSAQIRAHIVCMLESSIRPSVECRCLHLTETWEGRQDHFAVFPEELPRKCIAAGTSEKGCCPECGAPVVRVVEKSGGTIGTAWNDHADDMGAGMSQTHDALNNKELRATYKCRTTGWKPGCGCGPAPVPCTVLDPFGGAGTTALVAARMGRSAILIELNPKYAEMAADRIRRECGLLAVVEVDEGVKDAVAQ